MSVNPTVFIVAGEPSGDELGAALMGALSSATNNRIHFVGIGGEAMRSEGLTSLFPMEELSVMGLVEVVPRIPLLWRRIKETAELIKRLQPAAIVTIDSPGFNFRVVRQLENIDIPIIHYVAPTVWAWKPKRAKEMARLFDHLMVLLPFERKYFEKEGLACTFVGHPAAKHKNLDSGEPFRIKYHLSDSTVLGVFPGSRVSEVQRMLPVFTETVRLLQTTILNLHILITIVSSTKNIVERYMNKFSVPVTLVENKMDKFEKLIYSVKYLPQLLFFGSLAWVIYSIYTQIYLDYEYNELFSTVFFSCFLYITCLAAKNYKTKDEYGGKK